MTLSIDWHRAPSNPDVHVRGRDRNWHISIEPSLADPGSDSITLFFDTRTQQESFMMKVICEFMKHLTLPQIADCSVMAGLRKTPVPEGVTVVNLDEATPEELHSVISGAVGE